MILYRSVGLQELELIYDSGMKAFPASLPQQPIFYPVLDLEYARQTASAWNSKRAGAAGYVTEFKVEDAYIKRFKKHTVGKSEHQEFWIPAEDMEDFNQHIVGHIKVLEAHFGKKFQGFVPGSFGLQGKDAVEQFTLLANSYVYKRMDFYLEIKRNHKAVFLNYPFWQKHEFKNPGLKAKVIQAIKEAWLTSFPNIPLLTVAPQTVTPARQADPEALGDRADKKIVPVPPKVSRPAGPAVDRNPKPATPRNSPSVVDPVRPKFPPIRKIDSRPLVDRFEEETRPATSIDSRPRGDTRDQEATPLEQSLVDREEQDTAPVSRTASGPMNQSVEEGSTAEESTDSDSFLDDWEEEDASVKPIDSRTWGKAAAEEQTESESFEEDWEEQAAAVQPADSHAWRKPADEEEKDSDSFEDDLEEEVASAKPVASHAWGKPVDEEQTDPDSFADLDEEDAIAEERSDSESLVELDEEQDTFAQPTHSRPSAPAVPRDVTPVTPINPGYFVRPGREAPGPAKPAVSHFSQGLEAGLKGQYHEAIDELTRAVGDHPDDVVAYTSLGVAFQRVGQEDRALSCYEIAGRIDPRYPEAHYFKANLLYRQGKVREAMAEYTTAIGLAPQLIEAHQKPAPQDRLTDYQRGPAEMYRIARPAQHILALNQSLEAHPRQANLFKERAADYARLWNYEQAIADYNSYLAMQPDDAEAFHARGIAYEQVRQFERAIRDYQQAVAIDPQLPNAYLQRGVKLGQTGNFHQSLANLTDGIRLAPQNPDAYFNRGMTYYQLGDLQSAIADFSTVIQLSPKDDAAYYWRGISHEAAGRRDEAIADYQEFLRLSRDENLRVEIEQKLKRWKVRPPDRGGARVLPKDRQMDKQTPEEGPRHEPDLYDLIAALGERALRSTWLGSGVECEGENAEELHARTDYNRPIPGPDLLDITAGIRRTIQGDFTAFDRDATAPWLFIRAWDGNGFYLETNDSQVKQRLKSQFQEMEEVEGATPSYEGLFIRI